MSYVESHMREALADHVLVPVLDTDNYPVAALSVAVPQIQLTVEEFRTKALGQNLNDHVADRLLTVYVVVTNRDLALRFHEVPAQSHGLRRIELLQRAQCVQLTGWTPKSRDLPEPLKRIWLISSKARGAHPARPKPTDITISPSIRLSSRIRHL